MCIGEESQGDDEGFGGLCNSARLGGGRREEERGETEDYEEEKRSDYVIHEVEMMSSADQSRGKRKRRLTPFAERDSTGR